jgi:transcriptional regulator with XRE-family HTH domain
MNIKTVFNQRLKKIRNDKGLTRQQIFESTGVSTDTLKSWEYGNTKPTVENLKVLAQFYKVSLDYIAGLTDNPEINK